MTGNAVYIGISLLSKKSFNMDKLLHRGKYRVAEDHDHAVEDVKLPWSKKIFGITPEFDRHDRFIAYLIVGWFVFWLMVFCVGMVYAKIFHPSDAVWAKFWLIYLIILFVMAVITTIWFSIGSVRDILRMFASLKTQMRNDDDDGFVREDDSNDDD